MIEDTVQCASHVYRCVKVGVIIITVRLQLSHMAALCVHIVLYVIRSAFFVSAASAVYHIFFFCVSCFNIHPANRINTQLSGYKNSWFILFDNQFISRWLIPSSFRLFWGSVIKEKSFYSVNWIYLFELRNNDLSQRKVIE